MFESHRHTKESNMNKDLIRNRSTGIAFWARRNVHFIYPIIVARKWFWLARKTARRQGDLPFEVELSHIENSIIN